MVDQPSTSNPNPPPAPPPPPTPAPPTNKRSYANIVQNLPPTHFQHDPARAAKKIFQEESLQEIGTVSKYKGLPSITYTEDETSQLSDRLKFALIGKFSHGLPNLNFLRQRIVKLGLRGSVNVGPLNFKHVLIMLSNEEDYSRIWLRGEWSFDGFPMRIFKWTADFDPHVESPIAPIWLRLPDLPCHLFEKNALFSIAKQIGKPLRMDEATADLSRPNLARICVEVDLTAPRIQQIFLNIKQRTIKQQVIYENCPLYCNVCKHLGHDHTTCLFNGSIEQAQNELSTRNIEGNNQQQEYKEALRMAANTRSKGKKVLFANEPQAEEINNCQEAAADTGHKEVNAGISNPIPSTLNDEIMPSALNDDHGGSTVNTVGRNFDTNPVNGVTTNMFAVETAEKNTAVSVNDVVNTHAFDDNMLKKTSMPESFMHLTTACEPSNMTVVNHEIDESDDFNYDDPLIAALLDKNWDEEMNTRRNNSDLIADIEAINEILDKPTCKTPKRNQNLTSPPAARNSISPASAGSIPKIITAAHTKSPRTKQILEHRNTNHYATPSESEDDEPTPISNRFQSLEGLNDLDLTNEMVQNTVCTDETEPRKPGIPQSYIHPL
ncbi:hypothetical protein Salat_0263300 [Sesamum alatum]|uniref:DUF4283 domain-containing protein n=1 Tax=Sesamum alatum TaxID=300844 RepID=A0AAE1YZS7_9LAMI|nr:hypothetical protein Salat_0263300 [Sesamum alatum]